MSSEYDDWTVARLKDEVRERNLTISGKKSILIERLIEDDQTDNCERQYPHNTGPYKRDDMV